MMSSHMTSSTMASRATATVAPEGASATFSKASEVRISHLSHRYATGTLALDDISLHLLGCEPIAIIGQNGSGKTTLIKHFNGLLHPTSGSISINGIKVEEHNTAWWAHQVGFVFQNPSDQLFQDSVREELAWGLQGSGLSASQKTDRVESVAKLVGLADQMNLHPFDLNPSERKLCAMGAALVLEPRILVLDEPTGGQDFAGQRRLAEIITELHRRGVLVIMITHDMRFVAQTCQRVIALKQGHVLLDGSVREVFSHPEVLAQTFVSVPPLTRISQAVSHELHEPNWTALDVEEITQRISRGKGGVQNTDQ